MALSWMATRTCKQRGGGTRLTPSLGEPLRPCKNTGLNSRLLCGGVPKRPQRPGKHRGQGRALQFITPGPLGSGTSLFPLPELPAELHNVHASRPLLSSLRCRSAQQAPSQQSPTVYRSSPQTVLYLWSFALRSTFLYPFCFPLLPLPGCGAAQGHRRGDESGQMRRGRTKSSQP